MTFGASCSLMATATTSASRSGSGSRRASWYASMSLMRPGSRWEPKPNSGWGPIKVRPLMRFLWYSARHGGLRIRPVREVMTFADGDVLDLPGSPHIIHVPGHTPGSVAVHIPAVDAVFVGDAMTTGNVLTGESGPRPAPFTLDPESALASLAKLEAREGNWFCPATARRGAVE